MFKKFLFALLTISLILPFLSFAQEYKIPKTFDEAKTLGVKAIPLLPKFLKEIWQDFLKEFGNFFYKIWRNYLQPFLNNLLKKIKVLFIKEFEKRKPIIQEEFSKEKKELNQEIRNDISKGFRLLWQRLKELIK